MSQGTHAAAGKSGDADRVRADDESRPARCHSPFAAATLILGIDRTGLKVSSHCRRLAPRSPGRGASITDFRSGCSFGDLVLGIGVYCVGFRNVLGILESGRISG